MVVCFFRDLLVSASNWCLLTLTHFKFPFFYKHTHTRCFSKCLDLLLCIRDFCRELRGINIASYMTILNLGILLLAFHFWSSFTTVPSPQEGDFFYALPPMFSLGHLLTCLFFSYYFCRLNSHFYLGWMRHIVSYHNSKMLCQRISRILLQHSTLIKLVDWWGTNILLNGPSVRWLEILYM